jgi:hypothetical protein
LVFQAHRVPVDVLLQTLLLHTLQLWNYATTSADLFKHIVQGQYCKSDHLVDWTLAVLEDPFLDTFLPDRRSAWAEDVFVFGFERASTRDHCFISLPH